LKKAPSGRPGQADSPSGQGPYHSHLCGGQGIRQVNYQQNHEKRKLRLAQGKQYLRDTCPKGKLDFKFILALFGEKLMRCGIFF